MGMAALGIGPGDEVILADSNWIASAAPIVHLGATPVFVDVLPTSWCLDPACVEAAITSRTRAILAVHLYGNLCDMDALLAIGKRYGLPVIEDAAEAIGSLYGERRAGSLGRFGTFSFHGTKTLTTGEGGMFVTDDAELYERVLTLSNHGRSRGQTRQFWPDVLGFKYKMSNLQAAIGCAQMERIDALIARKREILAGYRRRLQHISALNMNPEPPGTKIGAWMPTVVFAASAGVNREQMLEAFNAEDIDARVFFHPLSSLPMFSPRTENVHAYDIPKRALNLPSYHDMTEVELDRVAHVIQSLADA
jgi:perosamine synthetase